jgi:hypothetical protein
MEDRNWKGNERSIASILGGERIPVWGRALFDSPDIKHDRLSIEVKLRRELPRWIRTAPDPASAAKRDRQMRIAVLHD